MSDEKVEVKNIFQGSPGDGGGRDGGAGIAAVIAALGGRNERGFGGDGGFGFGGGGGLGAILALALLGRDFGGRDRGHSHDNGCCDNLGFQAVLGKLGSIEAAVPLSALQVQNSIQEQTIGINNSLGALALGTQQGFANTKDSVQAAAVGLGAAIAGTKDAIQNGLFLTNNNLSEGICSVKAAIQADGAETRALLVTRFQLEDQTKIATQAAEIIELRNEGRNRDLHSKIEINNTAIAAQAQGQQQQQFQALVGTVNNLVPLVHGLFNEVQVAKATNANLIVGSTGVVTGPQTANPTNVRA